MEYENLLSLLEAIDWNKFTLEDYKKFRPTIRKWFLSVEDKNQDVLKALYCIYDNRKEYEMYCKENNNR